jgi:replication factor A1
VVRSADPKRTFDRDDGSEGQVRNIRIQDETGDIRVALWGDLADRDVAPGDEVQLTDVEIQDGFQDDLEASANWRSTLTTLEDGSTASTDERTDATGSDPAPSDGRDGSEGSTDAGAVGLDAFGNGESPTAAAENGENGDEERVEFTGVVVQEGDPVVLDDGEETISVATGEDLELGEEVTIQGRREGGRVYADEIASSR